MHVQPSCLKPISFVVSFFLPTQAHGNAGSRSLARLALPSHTKQVNASKQIKLVRRVEFEPWFLIHGLIHLKKKNSTKLKKTKN
jgi:hypothetical protein